MSEYNIQMNKYNALNAEYDQLYPQPMKHASTHAKDGDDPITPSSIGAAELGADGKVPESQLPSMGYSKSETISDTTKTLFGLDATAVPDDALALLSRFHKGLGNEYVWGKAKVETQYALSFTDNSACYFFAESSISTIATIYYSDSVIATKNGVELVDPIEIAFNRNTVSSVIGSPVLSNKYVKVNNALTEIITGNSEAVYKIPETYGIETGTSHNYYVASYAYASLVTSNAFQGETSYGYVNSPDPSAYPPAVSDGYTYTALGQLGAKVQIATGSYTGTGTYGSSNPNSLTFEFRPKILFLFDASGYLVQLGSSSNRAIAFLQNLTESYVSDVLWSWLYNNNYTNAKFSENTLYWYHASGANYQLNNSGVTYNYIAIG